MLEAVRLKGEGFRPGALKIKKTPLTKASGVSRGVYVETKPYACPTRRDSTVIIADAISFVNRFWRGVEIPHANDK